MKAFMVSFVGLMLHVAVDGMPNRKLLSGGKMINFVCGAKSGNVPLFDKEGQRSRIFQLRDQITKAAGLKTSNLLLKGGGKVLFDNDLVPDVSKIDVVEQQLPDLSKLNKQPLYLKLMGDGEIIVRVGKHSKYEYMQFKAMDGSLFSS